MKIAAILTATALSALVANASPDTEVHAVARSGALGPARAPQDEPTAYDARFTFVRLRYAMSADPQFGMRGGGRFNDDPPWHHDFPRAERNLMHIIAEVTTVEPFKDGSRIIDIGDPELFKYPVAYMSEPGFWTMNDQEAENLRNYLAKGGFMIFDDFGGRHWANLATQMARLLPRGRWLQMDASHPIFHVFFDINSLDNVRPSYRGQPVFFGMFEDNDPKKRLLAIANYNNDIGEDWEFSDTGFVPVDNENESYKFGINYMIYGLTH
ncbi:MAG TPA: DUF4159 domain-containing protein [Longimicrobiales bacterium]